LLQRCFGEYSDNVETQSGDSGLSLDEEEEGDNSGNWEDGDSISMSDGRGRRDCYNMG